MAIYQVANSTALINRLTGNGVTQAAPGDILELAQANFTLTRQTPLTFASPYVTIRPADRDNPPVFLGTDCLVLDQVGGLIFDGIVFRGTQVSATIAGVQYPGGRGIVLKRLSNITFKHCTFDFYLRSIEVGINTHPNSNLTIQRCEFVRQGMDCIRLYDGVETCLIEWNLATDPRIRLDGNPPWVLQDGHHADFVQLANQDGQVPSEDLTIRFNRMLLGETYQKPLFLQSQRTNSSGSNLDEVGHKRVKVYGNFSTSNRTHGYFINGFVDSEIGHADPRMGNVIRQAGNYENVRISIWGRCRNTIIRNNYMPNGFLTNGAGTLSDFTISGNVVTNTGLPANWLGPTSDSMVGPYSDATEPVPPTQPTQLTNETTHGKIQPTNVFFAGNFGTPEQPYYGGVFTVPTTSPAYYAAPDFYEFRWKDAVIADQPMRLSPTMPTNALGEHRYEMQAVNLATLVHCRPIGENTHSGIQVAYRQRVGGNGVWSAYSSYSGAYTTPAGGVQVPPAVSAIALDSTTYAVGQTATVNWDVAPGTGTGFTQTLEILLGAAVVDTQSPSAGARSATYVTAATGTLTARLTASSSVPPASTLTSSGSTVTATPTAPVISAVALDRPSYIVGDTALAQALFSSGNGTGLTAQFEFELGGVTFATVPAIISGGTATASTQLASTGDLTVTFTVTTSAGSDNDTSAISVIGSAQPPAAGHDDWQFVAVVAAAGFVNRFTAQFIFPVTGAINVGAVTAVQWTFTPTDAGSWRPTSNAGTHVTGRTLYQLEPFAPGGSAHTVGFAEQSGQVYIRYSTAGGTSDPSPSPGKTFTGPSAPPQGGETLDPPIATDWAFFDVVPVPGLSGRFTAQIRFDPAGNIDDADVLSVEWIVPSGANQWALALDAGVDGGGETLWQMTPFAAGGSEHTVGYSEQSPAIYIRYTTAAGVSAVSTTSKTFTGDAAPGRPAIVPDVGTRLAVSGGDLMTLNGRRLVIPPEDVPTIIEGEIGYVVVSGTVTFLLPLIMPPGAVALGVSYGSEFRIADANGRVTFPYVEASPLWLASAINAKGRKGVPRFGLVVTT